MTLDELKGMPMVSYGFDGGILLSRIYSDYLEFLPICGQNRLPRVERSAISVRNIRIEPER